MRALLPAHQYTRTPIPCCHGILSKINDQGDTTLRALVLDCKVSFFGCQNSANSVVSRTSACSDASRSAIVMPSCSDSSARTSFQ